ncbi:MAG TPA: hypothetical protein VF582_06575 [Allosphingosinicella sp.]|jgi:hypothetical protein
MIPARQVVLAAALFASLAANGIQAILASSGPDEIILQVMQPRWMSGVGVQRVNPDTCPLKESAMSLERVTLLERVLEQYEILILQSEFEKEWMNASLIQKLRLSIFGMPDELKSKLFSRTRDLYTADRADEAYGLISSCDVR